MIGDKDCSLLFFFGLILNEVFCVIGWEAVIRGGGYSQLAEKSTGRRLGSFSAG